MLSVCVLCLNFLHYLRDFHKVRYECFDTGCRPNHVLLNFILHHPVVTKVGEQMTRFSFASLSITLFSGRPGLLLPIG